MPGWYVGPPERGGGVPPVGPRDPPVPPDGGPPFCARSGTEVNAMAKAQNAVRFKQAIPGLLRGTTISQMLNLFYAVSRQFFELRAERISRFKARVQVLPNLHDGGI
jgi:hypothetical protein